MIKTFQGYFQEGRFVSPQRAAIPEYVEVLIVVTDKPITTASSQMQTFEDSTHTMADAESINDVIDKTIPLNKSTERNHRLLRAPDPNKSSLLGCLEGLVKIPDDFDEPLEKIQGYYYPTTDFELLLDRCSY